MSPAYAVAGRVVDGVHLRRSFFGRRAPLDDASPHVAALEYALGAVLGGWVKSRNLTTVQNPQFPAASETGEFYFVASSVRKSVCSFVRQLRGPHLSTCA